MKTRSPRRSLTKAQLQTAVGAELAQLLESTTSDGTVSKREVTELSIWLRRQNTDDLPGAKHLLSVLDEIQDDGVVTPEETDYLQKEIESVLPVELRREAKAARQKVDSDERARLRADADKARSEKLTQRALELESARITRPVYRLDFMVAGVSHDGRGARVDRILDGIEYRNVELLREPTNPYDCNAVLIFIDRFEVGYVPRVDAVDLAPLLDSSHGYSSSVKGVIEGRQYSIPIIILEVFAPDHPHYAGKKRALPDRPSTPIAIGDNAAFLVLLVILVGLLIFVLVAGR